MKRKILALFLALMLSSSVTVCAQDDITVLLDGTQVDFLDQPPIIVSDRTLVPFRAIFEALDCTVEWDADHYAVYATYREGNYQRVISLLIGKPVVMYTDQVLTDGTADTIRTSGTFLDVSPEIYDSRTFVPLRAVSEILGATVGWDGNTRTVTIQTGESFGVYTKENIESSADSAAQAAGFAYYIQ